MAFVGGALVVAAAADILSDGLILDAAAAAVGVGVDLAPARPGLYMVAGKWYVWDEVVALVRGTLKRKANLEDKERTLKKVLAQHYAVDGQQGVLHMSSFPDLYQVSQLIMDEVRVAIRAKKVFLQPTLALRTKSTPTIIKDLFPTYVEDEELNLFTALESANGTQSYGTYKILQKDVMDNRMAKTVWTGDLASANVSTVNYGTTGIALLNSLGFPHTAGDETTAGQTYTCDIGMHYKYDASFTFYNPSNVPAYMKACIYVSKQKAMYQVDHLGADLIPSAEESPSDFAVRLMAAEQGHNRLFVATNNGPGSFGAAAGNLYEAEPSDFDEIGWEPKGKGFNKWFKKHVLFEGVVTPGGTVECPVSRNWSYYDLKSTEDLTATDAIHGHSFWLDVIHHGELNYSSVDDNWGYGPSRLSCSMKTLFKGNLHVAKLGKTMVIRTKDRIIGDNENVRISTGTAANQINDNQNGDEGDEVP